MAPQSRGPAAFDHERVGCGDPLDAPVERPGRGHQASVPEVFGDGLVGTDKFLRTVGWRRVAEQENALAEEESKLLLDAYAAVAALHNASGITEPVPVGEERIWGRPFAVLWGDFPGALAEAS